MSDTKLDLTCPVQTRDGRKVRILCTDADSPQGPIVGLIRNHRGGETATSWYHTGSYLMSGQCSSDLINVPPPKKKVSVAVRVFRSKFSGNLLSVSEVVGNGPLPRVDSICSGVLELEYEDQP